MVDIHKTAYGDAKEFVESNLEEVKDLDGLKSKVTTKMSGLATEAEDLLASIKDRGVEKKEALQDEAKNTASGLSDTVVDKLASWIDTAKAKLDAAHTGVKEKLDAPRDEEKTTVAKKPAPKKKVPTSPKTGV